MLPWQKRTMAIILWRNSLRAILRIMFSFYKPVKYMYIICITTSIICTFNTHGKHSNPQDHYLSYYAIIRNHERYCNMEFIKVNIIYKSILKLVLLFQTLQLIAQRPITSIYEKTQKYLLIKVHGEWKPMTTCAYNAAHVSKPKQKTLVGGKGKQALFILNQKKQLGTHTREPSLWEWTKGYPINFLSPFIGRE